MKNILARIETQIYLIKETTSRGRLAQMVERSLRKFSSVGTRVRDSAQDFQARNIYISHKI